MKARIKATGEIVEVVFNGFYYESIKDERIFDKPELEIMSKTKDPDYQTRLKHQYAGMFLQAQISYGEQEDLNTAEMVEDAMIYAHALVEKLKEEQYEDVDSS